MKEVAFITIVGVAIMWANYRISQYSCLKGVIEEDNGRILFNTIDRLQRGEPAFEVNEKDIERLGVRLLNEDYQDLIELSLLTKDAAWFEEILQHR